MFSSLSDSAEWCACDGARYYDGSAGQPLFEFGSGLSYTRFALSCAQRGAQTKAATVSGAPAATGVVDCELRNVGEREGDEVVFAFHSAGRAIRAAAGYPVPLKSLVAFERVTLAAGKSAKVRFELGKEAFALTNAKGDKVGYSGKRTLIFSRGTGRDVRLAATRGQGK